MDLKADQVHPVKRQRPIASGIIKPQLASFIAALCALLAVGWSLSLNSQFTIIVVSYGLMNIIYSLILKKIVLIDVMVIALGFVLRILAGSALIMVSTSHWILLCTFFGSLFIGFAKRKHEVDSLNNQSQEHRVSLKYYSAGLLQQLISLSAALSIMSYTLYTIDDNTVARFQTDKLYITVLFVVFGMFHYLHIIYNQAMSGDPTKTFLSNKPLLLTLCLWLISFFLIIYI